MGSQIANPSENKPSDDEICQKPWKYLGYPGYANFISSDDDFFVLRRFNILNTRISLALQDEICALEDELAQVDKFCSDKQTQNLNNGTFRGDVKERKDLVEAISKKLYHYNKFVFQQSSVKKLPRPLDRDVATIKLWHMHYQNRAIDDDERKYLDFTDDLLCVAPREKTPVRRLLDKPKWLRTLSLWEEKQKNERMASQGIKDFIFYSDRRMDKVASGIVVAIGVVMLLAPIWILQALRSLQAKLAVISAFIFVFLLTLSFAMVSKPFEALGATAGYAAVLMVFVQFGTD